MGVDQLVTGGSVTDPDVDSLTTDAVDYNSLTPDYRIAGPYVQSEGLTSNPTTTSTSYSTILEMAGADDISDIPTNATLYGRLVVQMKISNSSNKVFAVPKVDNGSSDERLGELEVTHTGDTNFTRVDSGWVEITSSISGVITFPRLEGKVDGGTGTHVRNRHGLLFAGVVSTA
jgi:hypothetical protein